MNAEGESQLMTIREWRETGGIPLGPEDFVTEPEACGRFYIPLPTVHRYLMEETGADRAEAALETCVRNAGGWGQRLYRAGAGETQEFEEAAREFQEVTGVNVLQVLGLAQSRLDALAAW